MTQTFKLRDFSCEFYAYFSIISVFFSIKFSACSGKNMIIFSYLLKIMDIFCTLKQNLKCDFYAYFFYYFLRIFLQILFFIKNNGFFLN